MDSTEMIIWIRSSPIIADTPVITDTLGDVMARVAISAIIKRATN